MTQYHLTGMGVLGSFLAWELYIAKKSFTWNDSDSTHVAWKASTGLIYPSGDAQEMNAYHCWSRWHQEEAPWTESIGCMSEAGAFWFTGKNPPHGASYSIVAQNGVLSLASIPSYHLHVQAFVEITRAFFANRRIEKPYQHAQSIVSHGFSFLCDHYVWGWSQKIYLAIDTELLSYSSLRPTFYLREYRFQMAYANIVAGTPYHYAGSSLIPQHDQKEYLIEPKYRTWKTRFERLTEGHIKVQEELLPLEQGWRPTAEKRTKYCFYKKDSILYAPPMSGSGVRLAPILCAELRNIL